MHNTTRDHRNIQNPVPLYVFGEILFDIFPDGQKKLGGAPFNVAWHLHAFNAQPRLISAVGDDELGDEALTAITDWTMDTQHIEKVVGVKTAKVTVHFDEGTNRYEIDTDTAFDSADYKLPQDIAQPSLLYHGTLALRGEKNRSFLTKLCASAEFRKFIDVNLREPFWDLQTTLELVQSAYCVKLSDEELQPLSDQPIDHSPAGLEAAALEFKHHHQIANLVVTCGADGAFIINELDECIRTEALNDQIDVVDTVGAGDAFSSIIILGITRGWEWDICLERAQQFANYIISIQGATTNNRSIYNDLKTLWSVD